MSNEWQELDFEPGEAGEYLCEILGLDPKIVAAEPLRVLISGERVYVKYTGLSETTLDNMALITELIAGRLRNG